MTEQKHDHLQEEQLRRAIIDEQDMQDDSRLHLQACPACRRRVDRFRNELHGLGRKAVRAVPPLVRPVRLPSEKKRSIPRNGAWLPLFGAAAMAGLLLIFYFMTMDATTPSLQVSTLANQEILLEDEVLMREISEIVENPLPEEIYEITGDSASPFEEDFLEFMVPEIEDDYQSGLISEGETTPC